MYGPKRAPSSGMYDNLSASRAKYPQHASHNILQGELCERVVYNDQSVLEDLRIMDVPDSFIKSCKYEFYEALAEDIQKLTEIQATADGFPVEELEEESLRQRHLAGSAAKRKVPKTAREREMYGPLQRIFDYIQGKPDIDATTRQGPPRRFQSEGSPLNTDDDHAVGFPRWTPDFSLVHDATKDSKETGKLWRHRDGFVEVKPSSNQHPYPGTGNQREGPAAERERIYDNGTAKPLITQVANYSRLHLSARAFAIQSVGLMIFGCDFCVSIFNHANGRVSPCYNMWEDIEVFIRVVRSMTHILTDHQLWQDRTTEWIAPERVGLPAIDNHDYTYLIQPIPGDDRKWCTVGSNIWSSLSLFGRGTTIWPVQAYRDGVGLEGQVMVLKTAFRSDQRLSESTIYQQIKRRLREGEHWPQGLAQLVLGGDVGLRGRTPFPIDFFTHMGTSESTSSPPRAVLNRIITAPMGRRIWDYTSDRELVKGLLCALEAHKWLCSKGWLHRDISAGNILLAMRPDDPAQAPGFLIDLEYAQTPSNDRVVTETVAQKDITSYPDSGRSSLVSTSPQKVTHTRFDGPLRGAPITGTLHFLSRRQLSMVLDPSSDLKPTPGDDVESFFLVLIYAVIRSLALRLDVVESRKKELLDFFEEHWGAKTVQEIYKSRAHGSFLQTLLSDGLVGNGTVGRWFLTGGQVLISDALLNHVITNCFKKFSNLNSLIRPRNRL
ncbi:hypothetical protein V8D89_003487, partial [Ganoderma adspersum]